MARSTGTIRWALFGAVLALAGCAGGEDVTTRSIADARRQWERAGVRDYDLEWTSNGLSRAHYLVTVRDGQVRAIASILPDGKRLAVRTPQPRFYGVEGLFMIISDELAQLRTNTPFGQPKGTRAVLRFTPDPKLGYPRRYRRDVLGTPLALAIDVVRFQPEPSSSPSSSSASSSPSSSSSSSPTPSARPEPDPDPDPSS